MKLSRAERHGTHAWGSEEKKKSQKKTKEAETQVLPSPFQLVVGVEAPCIFQAKEWPRLVGLEQEAEGPRLQAEAAAAVVVEEDTCHLAL